MAVRGVHAPVAETPDDNRRRRAESGRALGTDQKGMEVIGAGMIDESEARVLLDSPDLIAIGVRADPVRQRLHGSRTTFVRVFEIHVDAPPASLPAGLSAGEFRIIGRPASLEAAIEA